MGAFPHPPWLSVEDYLSGELSADVKHEYVGGRIYAMAGGRNVHHRVSGNFFAAMHRRLRDTACEPFNSDTKVRILLPRQTRFYYPDGMVVCDTNGPQETYQDRPVVLAEVLSDSTRRIDEGEKLEAYLRIPTLRVYLLVEPDRPYVTAYRRGGRGFEPEVYEAVDAVVTLPEIRIELPLAELYERVNLSGDA